MTNCDWITFELNLEKLTYQDWIRLGECVAKCEQIKTIPLKPHVKNKLHLVSLAKGVHATTAIEGNTLTQEQVEAIIEKKLKLPPSKKYLEKEVDNILDGLKEIATQISTENFGQITAEKICNYNDKVLRDVPHDEDAVPGKIRTHNVVVGNVYRAPESKDVTGLVEKFCNWMNSGCFENEQMPVHLAIIKAVAAHLYIAWIHPFGDGNGRVARLLEFAILLNSGVPSPAAHLLSNHYNMTRSEYYKQLDKASKTGDPTDFFSYAIAGFLDGLNEQLNQIQEHVIDVCWREYIFEHFRQVGHSPPIIRCRTLALKITEAKIPIDKTTLMLLVSDEYKGKTEITLIRDLNKLEKIEMITVSEGKYAANKKLMLQFLPFSTS